MFLPRFLSFLLALAWYAAVVAVFAPPFVNPLNPIAWSQDLGIAFAWRFIFLGFYAVLGALVLWPLFLHRAIRWTALSTLAPFAPLLLWYGTELMMQPIDPAASTLGMLFFAKASILAIAALYPPVWIGGFLLYVLRRKPGNIWAHGLLGAAAGAAAVAWLYLFSWILVTNKNSMQLWDWSSYAFVLLAAASFVMAAVSAVFLAWKWKE